ncbi:MAG: polysaccharide biosynthesis/export family protein [Longimicrobiales bacterium]
MINKTTRALAAALLAISLGHAPVVAQQALPQGGGGGGASESGALVAGDLIRLSFWLDQELSGDYVVDEAGEVVLPLLGIRNAVDVTPQALKRDLRLAYDGVLRNQDVQILLLRRVRVLGQVGKPGLYHAEMGMTVSDILAMAEGVGEDGDEDEVQLIRRTQVMASGLEPDLLVGTNLQSGDQVYVPKQNWFSRNANVVVGAAASITVALIYRGFFN